jgi:tetratricopeptide (TPR) repeat protein
MCLVLLAAAPAFTESLDATPIPPDTTELYGTIERGRQALVANKYVDASNAFDEVLRTPQFAEAPKSDQFRVFLWAALAARGRDDLLGAHEYIVIATEFPDATADHWSMRAQFAVWVEAWADAGFAITTQLKRWPGSVSNLDDETVAYVAMRMQRDEKLASERLALFNALFAARYQREWNIEPTEMWRDLALDALERKDLVRAREILKRIDSAGTLLRMRIDRRFDELVRREPKAFDVAAAAENQCRQLHGVIGANPRKLGPIVQYMYALLTVARYQELLTLADRTLSRQAQAPKDKPAFDDVADKLNWIYDLKSQGLRGLGRWDEALAIQEAARGQRDSSTDKVSQAINLGSSYINRDRPNDALKSLEDIDWVHSLSGYGRMQLQHVRFRAYLQLGDREEAEKVFVYLRQNKIDAEDTWQDAMLEWGDVDGAAAQYIARLHDPEQRIEALYAAQTFKPVPRLPRETEYNTRWQALLDRADVTAAINEVGRREQHPIYDLWN